MESIKDKKIIVDSNIWIYFYSDTHGRPTRDLIDQLKNQRCLLAYSAITSFEVQKNRQTSELSDLYSKLLNEFDRVPVDSPALINAATIYYLYVKYGCINVRNSDQLENMIDPKDRLTGDLIIAGTVLSWQNRLLLTANRRDFPEMFWDSIAEVTLKDTGTTVYLLRFKEDKIPEEIGGIEDTENLPSMVFTSDYHFRG